ncbi:MAG: FHA domain-containing protein [Planctomycetota bacterium]
MQVMLVMFKADGNRRDFSVSKDKIIVGRKANCDLRIPLTSVSRQHCELTLDGDTIKLRDLGSSNGTFHNSIRVQEAELSAGDELVIGPVVFTVVVDGQPDEIKPVRTILGGDSDDASPSPTMSDSAEELMLEDDFELPTEVEAEASTPTVDLDDDPIAALEALADADDDDDDFEVPILLDDDEERR